MLLFLDVDGPLIPFGAKSYPTYRPASTALSAGSNPLVERINPAHGPRLLALGCELIWATTWMNDANDCISPWLGFPELPVMTWPEPSDQDEQDERAGLHWKTRALVDRAAGRTFIWIDDEITATDQAWVRNHHQGQALLHAVDPQRGLTDADFGTLHAFLATG
ncbi:HAD domain-containing protein [Kribbella sp. NPDC002412]